MALSVLIANDVAEQCYLGEALYWVALCRFPIGGLVETGEDGREYDDWMVDIDPPFSLDTVSKEECQFAGLPINPAWEAEQAFERHNEPMELRRWIARESDEQRRAGFQRALDESVAFHKNLANWKATFEAYLDLHSARLFVALRQGAVVAKGKPLPSRVLTQLVRQSEEDKAARRKGLLGGSSNAKRRVQPPSWSSVNWEQIPKDFWISKNIDWRYSCAAGENVGYAFVLAGTSQLFNEFPIPTDRPVRRVAQIGNGYVLFDEAGKAINPPSVSRGRRPFEWDKFHVEMTERIRSGKFPAKQEALIAEMQEWCSAHWGLEVGRSTLLQKIKPYYDRFIRPSEN